MSVWLKILCFIVLPISFWTAAWCMVTYCPKILAGLVVGVLVFLMIDPVKSFVDRL